MCRISAWLLLFVCTAMMRPVAAQEASPMQGMGIEANFMAGKILKHTKAFNPPLPDLVTSYELNFVQQTYGRKAWHKRHGYPLIGLGLTITDYGNNAIYGQCIGLYPTLQLPIVRYKNFEWTLKLGMGFGYITKRYERYPAWDTINNAIGSHINNFTTFSTDLRYRINERWDVQAGLNFSHASNASFRKPNLGINTYGARIGLRYFPFGSKPVRVERDDAPLKNRWLAQARLGLAGVEGTAPDGPLYPVYMASVYASKRYLGKNKAFAGIDYAYNSNVYAFLRNSEQKQGEEGKYSWRSTVFFGNEFLMGRVGLHLQLGFYLKNTFNSDNLYYEKLGFNLYILQREKGILKELFATTLLKAHGTEAELGEFGIGFGF